MQRRVWCTLLERERLEYERLECERLESVSSRVQIVTLVRSCECEGLVWLMKM